MTADNHTMTDRHLLPDEIDQLLDGEAGFGIAPLEAHVRECAQCQAELDAGRRVVDAIEHLPRLAPSPAFADRVMQQVNVYEPWDVAARDAVVALRQRLVPQSRPWRLAGTTIGLTLATGLSVLCVWLAGHLDAVFFVTSIGRARLRDAVFERGGILISAIFGTQTLDRLASGSPSVIFGVLAAVMTLVLVVGLGIRTVVSTSRRGRA